MHYSIHLRRGLFVCLLLVFPTSQAETVYKSIDAQGIVRFSDTPPQSETLLETVIIDNQASVPNQQAQQNLQNMRETTDRMVADRMAREKHRAELHKLERQDRASQVPQYPQPYDSRTSYPVYIPYHGRPYWHHPIHKRPRHHIVRAPLRKDLYPPNVIAPATGQRFPAPHIRPLFTPKTRGSTK